MNMAAAALREQTAGITIEILLIPCVMHVDNIALWRSIAQKVGPKAEEKMCLKFLNASCKLVVALLQPVSMRGCHGGRAGAAICSPSPVITP